MVLIFNFPIANPRLQIQEQYFTDLELENVGSKQGLIIQWAARGGNSTRGLHFCASPKTPLRSGLSAGSKLSSAQKQQIRGSMHADLSTDTNMCDNYSQATPLTSYTYKIQRVKQAQISAGDIKIDTKIHK